MICPKCGTAAGESHKECPVCGWELAEKEFEEDLNIAEAIPDADESANMPDVSKFSKGKLIGALSALAVVLICVALILPNLFHIGYKTVVSDYYKAIKNNDYALMMSLYPVKTLQIGGVSKDEYVKSAVDTASQNFSGGYGEDYKYSYKITSAKSVGSSDGAESSAELENVSEVIELSIQLTLTGNGKKDTVEAALTVIKQGGSWYLLS